MKNIKYSFFAFLLFLSSFTFVSCEDGINLFTDNDDVELGKQVVAEISANPKEYPKYTGDPAVKQYITERIFKHILNSSLVAKKNIYNYHLEIIQDTILNAFALPGGPVYVYTGLLKYLDSEAALAGVIAHEIAHIEKRHSTQRMTAYYGVSILLSIILGEKPSELAQLAANLFVGLAFLANSRSDENQADEFSFKYLKDTRYYPGGVKFFFEKMRDENIISSRKDAIATFLSTHPDPIARIADTEQRLSQAGYTIKNWTDGGLDMYKSEYQTNIRNKLP